jgi:hypothetical protein
VCVAAFFLVATGARAGDEEVLTWCEEYGQTHEGADSSGCSCLAEEVVGREDLKPEIFAYEGDLAAMSGEFRAVVETCWPDSELPEQ